MMVRLTPKYKFVCDRCGKEWFDPEDAEGTPVEIHKVEFVKNGLGQLLGKVKEGEVCTACATEFWELANNFFDEVNKAQ